VHDAGHNCTFVQQAGLVCPWVRFRVGGCFSVDSFSLVFVASTASEVAMRIIRYQ
jgi:hypothetical protein